MAGKELADPHMVLNTPLRGTKVPMYEPADSFTHYYFLLALGTS